jgi:hypothetical protein
MNSKELKNIWEAYNQVYEQIGVPIPPGKTARDVLEPLTKPHGGGKVIEPKKPTLQNAHYEAEGEQLSENPISALDNLGRSAAKTVGGVVGRTQGQRTGIPGGAIVGNVLGRRTGGQMYDRATQPLRGRVPGFNKGGTIKKEEVEIAAQYFYEMGLNEDGVDILIEELGLEEFANFVYDIAEEYILTEARRGSGGTKVKVEPVSKTGKPYKGTKKSPGKPPEKRIEELRAQKTERKAAENEASKSKPSGLKASLQRQSAVASAAKKQPRKPTTLDRLAGVVNRGLERHNAAMDAAKETGKVIGKAAKGVGKVGGEVVKGVYNTGRLAGHLARKGLSDEYIVGYLIDEGYANNDRSAFIIMSNMSEDWRGSITEQILSENALQDVGKNISNAAKMFRMMTGIDKMPQKPPSGPVNLNKIATQGSSKPQPQKQTFKIGTPPRPNATGQQNLMRSVRSNTQTRNPGVSLPTRSPHIAAAAAGLQSYNTGDSTLKAALRRGDYKPQQGPKNPDQGLTKAQSFDKAFKAARTSGQKEFTWNSKKYTTKVK